jgi:hypothetical protein
MVGDDAAQPVYQDKELVDFLIFFAVKEEAVGFVPQRGHVYPRFKTLLCGMGRRNSAHAIRSALHNFAPARVLTCGFAGGLNPELAAGTIVFDEDFDTGISQCLLQLNAVPAKFHCARRVAVTTQEKAQLWKETGADAVEMESSVIRTVCREQNIPSATIRVISDTAHDDLPLDFNALMTSDDRINFWKLTWTLLRQPRKIPKLIEFQKQVMVASRQLGKTLDHLLRQG